MQFAKSQIEDLQMSMQTLIDSKREVEAAVQIVLTENERLSLQVQLLHQQQQQHARAQNTVPTEESTPPLVFRREVNTTLLDGAVTTNKKKVSFQ